MPAVFELIFLLVPLLVAVFGLGIAVFAPRLSRWQIRGSDSTAQVEPSQTLLLIVRIGAVVIAAIALLMAFGTDAILP